MTNDLYESLLELLGELSCERQSMRDEVRKIEEEIHDLSERIESIEQELDEMDRQNNEGCDTA